MSTTNFLFVQKIVTVQASLLRNPPHLKFVCDKGAYSLLAKLHVLTVSAVNVQTWLSGYKKFQQ